MDGGKQDNSAKTRLEILARLEACLRMFDAAGKARDAAEEMLDQAQRKLAEIIAAIQSIVWPGLPAGLSPVRKAQSTAPSKLPTQMQRWLKDEARPLGVTAICLRPHDDKRLSVAITEGGVGPDGKAIVRDIVLPLLSACLLEALGAAGGRLSGDGFVGYKSRKILADMLTTRLGRKYGQKTIRQAISRLRSQLLAQGVNPYLVQTDAGEYRLLVRAAAVPISVV